MNAAARDDLGKSAIDKEVVEKVSQFFMTIIMTLQMNFCVL